jgi:hypothetical protein
VKPEYFTEVIGLYFFVCFTNGGVSRRDSINAVETGCLMCSDSERVWKEMVAEYFKDIQKYLSGDTEENHNILRKLVSWSGNLIY